MIVKKSSLDNASKNVLRSDKFKKKITFTKLRVLVVTIDNNDISTRSVSKIVRVILYSRLFADGRLWCSWWTRKFCTFCLRPTSDQRLVSYNYNGTRILAAISIRWYWTPPAKAPMDETVTSADSAVHLVHTFLPFRYTAIPVSNISHK